MATFTKNLKRINNVICSLPSYSDAIPLKTIFDAILDEGMVPLQEDGQEWRGLLCGAEGEAMIPLGDLAEVREDGTLVTDGEGEHVFKETKHTLRLSWYKMPSGRYETVQYVS